MTKLSAGLSRHEIVEAERLSLQAIVDAAAAPGLHPNVATGMRDRAAWIASKWRAPVPQARRQEG